MFQSWLQTRDNDKKQIRRHSKCRSWKKAIHIQKQGGSCQTGFRAKNHHQQAYQQSVLFYIAIISLSHPFASNLWLKSRLVEIYMEIPQRIYDWKGYRQTSNPNYCTTKKSDLMTSFLQRLTLFREKVLSSANEIKEEINEAIDRRSSCSEIRF